MSKLVVPWPVPDRWRDKTFLPNACWWRIAMVNNNEDGYRYFVSKNGPTDEETTAVEWTWFDGRDIILDGGFDRPEVAMLCSVYIRPIDYLDFLMEHRPTPEAYRITEYGNREHPGMVAVRDLDWNAK